MSDASRQGALVSMGAGCCVGLLGDFSGSTQDSRRSLPDAPVFLAGCCSVYLHCNETCFLLRGWLLVFIEHLIVEELQKQ